MDVTREEKVEALLRVIAAQTDPAKKSLARHFACDMFKVLFDPRLIYPMRDEFTNTVVWEDDERPENNPDDPGGNEPETESAKHEAVANITSELSRVGFHFDDPTYHTVDADADCARIGQWMDAKAALIEQKCLEARSAGKYQEWGGFSYSWKPRPE